MIIRYYFTDRLLNSALEITPDSHQNIHNNSKFTIKPNYLEVEKIFVHSLMKEIARFMQD